MKHEKRAPHGTEIALGIIGGAIILAMVGLIPAIITKGF